MLMQGVLLRRLSSSFGQALFHVNMGSHMLKYRCFLTNQSPRCRAPLRDTVPIRSILLRTPTLPLLLLLSFACASPFNASADQPPLPTETPAQAHRRHERVTERRRGVHVLCHRGSSEHAHENTLEAFRATFELSRTAE
jgi:hypothetical protein